MIIGASAISLSTKKIKSVFPSLLNESTGVAVNPSVVTGAGTGTAVSNTSTSTGAGISGTLSASDAQQTGGNLPANTTGVTAGGTSPGNTVPEMKSIVTQWWFYAALMAVAGLSFWAYKTFKK